MSKQIGFVKLKGKMGDVSFYSRKGVHSAKLGGGVSKERILTDPKFKRTRENIAEFGGLAQAVKSVRSAISKASFFKDGSIGNRLTKVFRTMMKRSVGIRGQRSILFTENRSLLKGFELNEKLDLFAVFAAPFSASVPMGSNIVTTTINNLTSDMIEAPANATHFRLVQLLGAVADTVYDAATGKFQPANVANGRSEVKYSDYTPVRFPDSINLSIDTAIDAPGSGLSIIHGLGIVFYEQIGTEYYSLAENAAMKIVTIFNHSAQMAVQPV